MAVPLVPFLSFGALVALFFGERLLDRVPRALLRETVKPSRHAADNPFEGCRP